MTAASAPGVLIVPSGAAWNPLTAMPRSSAGETLAQLGDRVARDLRRLYAEDGRRAAFALLSIAEAHANWAWALDRRPDTLSPLRPGIDAATARGALSAAIVPAVKAVLSLARDVDRYLTWIAGRLLGGGPADARATLSALMACYAIAAERTIADPDLGRFAGALAELPIGEDGAPSLTSWIDAASADACPPLFVERLVRLERLPAVPRRAALETMSRRIEEI